MRRYPIYDYLHPGVALPGDFHNGIDQTTAAGDPVRGNSVTGGYELGGRYFFADFIFGSFDGQGATSGSNRGGIYSGVFDSSTPTASFDGENLTGIINHTNSFEALGGVDVDFVSSFATDNAGNLYIIDFGDGAPFSPNTNSGEIFRVSLVPGPTIYAWSSDGTGNWLAAGSWVTSGVVATPNDNDHAVVFGSGVGGSTSATLNASVTVHRVEFDNSSSFALGGLGEINLAAADDGSLPGIDVVQGTHQFQLRVALDDDTNVVVGAGATLEFNSRVSLHGNTLTKTGAGTLSINNDVLASGGSVVCQEGDCQGVGSVAALVNNATVSPGNSPGVMQVGEYSQLDSGILLIELGGTARGSKHDLLSIAGLAVVDGTLAVTLIDQFQPTGGDRFDILDFDALVGRFESLQLPTLKDGLVWDTSSLYVSGLIAVVPEPSSLVFVLLCSTCFFAVSRTSKHRQAQPKASGRRGRGAASAAGLVACFTLLTGSAGQAPAQSILNGDFDGAFTWLGAGGCADVDSCGYGYGEIDGWSHTPTNLQGGSHSGVSVSSSAFYNNGLTSDPSRVAFLELWGGGNDPGSELILEYEIWQDVTGLVPGSDYVVSFESNGRAGLAVDYGSSQ